MQTLRIQAPPTRLPLSSANEGISSLGRHPSSFCLQPGRRTLLALVFPSRVLSTSKVSRSPFLMLSGSMPVDCSALTCRNISGPPESSPMKPKPRSAFRIFKVPVAILFPVFQPQLNQTMMATAVLDALAQGYRWSFPRAVAGVMGLQLQVATADRALHKKTTIRSANGVRIEGHVMVHRTDTAGGSMGQASPGNDRMCRRPLKWRPPRKQSFARSSARFSLRRQAVLPSPHNGSPAGPCDRSRTPDPMRL